MFVSEQTHISVFPRCWWDLKSRSHRDYRQISESPPSSHSFSKAQNFVHSANNHRHGWKERLSISKFTRFKGDMSKASKDRPDSQNLTDVCIGGGRGKLCPSHTNVCKILACVAGGIVWVGNWSFGGGRLCRQISLDYITTAPPPNLTRLLHNTASYAG